jgi:hypothetical protein
MLRLFAGKGACDFTNATFDLSLLAIKDSNGNTYTIIAGDIWNLAAGASTTAQLQTVDIPSHGTQLALTFAITGDYDASIAKDTFATIWVTY